jgi:hypothetical protein
VPEGRRLHVLASPESAVKSLLTPSLPRADRSVVPCPLSAGIGERCRLTHDRSWEQATRSDGLPDGAVSWCSCEACDRAVFTTLDDECIHCYTLICGACACESTCFCATNACIRPVANWRPNGKRDRI